MQGRVISEWNFNGSVVEGFHFSLTMHPSQCEGSSHELGSQSWAYRLCVEGKSLELRRIVDDQRPVRAVHIKKNKYE